MEGKMQFDEQLGGSERLPAEMTLKRFAAARAHEIEALSLALDKPQAKGLVFQRLPKHMRRRIMSHNVKRMPRRLREAHLRQMEKSGLPPKSKRPSRKYRRRPQNLLLEYNRRQRNIVWLETHIWHAKRFHMIDKWGYKLANYPNDKSFRACYRASANHCLLQDLSYYCCIELNGCLDEMLSGLKLITSEECNLSFGAKAYISGQREGVITLFHSGQYPFGAIGKVRFLWKPEKCFVSVKAENVSHRTLWMWVHPSYYEELLQELILIFSFEETNSLGSSNELQEAVIKVELCKDNNNEVEQPAGVSMALLKDAVNQFHLTGPLSHASDAMLKIPTYKSAHKSVNMVLLKDTLNRFRLTGPLSHAVILDALQVNNFPIKESCLSKSDGKMDVSGPSKCDESSVIHTLQTVAQPDESLGSGRWLSNLLEDSYWQECFSAQNEVWQLMKGATTPAELPPCIVLGLMVSDPRYQLPNKRKKVVPNEKEQWGLQGYTFDVPLAASSCPLWSMSLRASIAAEKPSPALFAKMRANNVVPGFVPEEMKPMSIANRVDKNQVSNYHFPVLLIQVPGSKDASTKRLGLGCGWDIVFPSGWAVSLWLALVFRGARVGALRESASLSFELGYGGIFAPDMSSGRAEEERCEQLLKEKHFRRPPSKRPNFIKLGVVCPFKCDWEALVSAWCNQKTDMNMEVDDKSDTFNRSFYVLRIRRKLEAVKLIFESFFGKNGASISHLVDIFPKYERERCLIPVVLTVLHKGRPDDRAMICIPTESDLRSFSAKQGPTEPLHKDCNKESRKLLQCEHKSNLNRERRKRKRETTMTEDCGETVTKKKRKLSPADEPSGGLTEINDLWLLKTDNVRNSCCREVFGFLTKGDFSFSESCGVGVGYVTVGGIVKLVQTSTHAQPLVLIRNTNSRIYRFAKLQIGNDSLCVP